MAATFPSDDVLGVDKKREPMRIVVATEQQEQTEALYVDGKLIQCEHTIYASEIAEATKGEACRITHRCVVVTGPFPDDESDLVDE